MSHVINFYSPNDDYGFMSNFSNHPIVVNGVVYKTTEHYFQSKKYAETDWEKKVIKAATPSEAARIGRDRSGPLRKDWEQVKDNVMFIAVKTKMEQYKDFCKELIDTEDAMLVEHTYKDSYWGDGQDGSGKNMLGKIYMKVREQMRNKDIL